MRLCFLGPICAGALALAACVESTPTDGGAAHIGVVADGNRLTLDLTLRVTPGANDDEDEYAFESYAVELNCSYTG